jgi:hypothetical protein
MEWYCIQRCTRVETKAVNNIDFVQYKNTIADRELRYLVESSFISNLKYNSGICPKITHKQT